MHILSLALSFLVSTALQAPSGVVPAQRAADDGPLVRLESRGIGGWLGDPRDAGLAAALALVGNRLAELPDELGEGAALPPGLLEVLGELCTRPLALRVYEGEPGGPFPFRAELVVAAQDEPGARTLRERAEGLLAIAGFEPAFDEQGNVLAPTDGGLVEFGGPLPIWIGTRGAAFVLALGSEPIGEPAAPSARGSALEFELALGRLLGVVRELEDDPELDAVIEVLGPEARLAWAIGSAGNVQLQSLEFEAPGLGLSAARLDRGLLAAMPAQATWALATSVSPLDLVRWIRRLSASAGDEEDPFAPLEEHLGLDLEDDLLAHLGAGWGAYVSDATGGGGLLSLVMLWEVARSEALAAGLEHIAARLDAMGAEEAQGYVRVRRREFAGAPTWTLEFPGLPVPVQPTLVLEPRHLLLALHPAGARAAQTLARGGGGLADHAFIAHHFTDRSETLAGITYFDAPALIRQGYGFVVGLGQMLENGLRSPRDPAREIPMVVPPLEELLRGARPWTGTLHIEDGVLRVLSQSDASMLAQTAVQMALVPAMYQALIGPMLLAAVPTLVVRGAQGMAVDSMDSGWVEMDPVGQARWDLLVIEEALYQFALNNDGLYPEELVVLVHPDENGWAYLGGGHGALIDPWGREYGYELPPAEGGIPRVFTLGRDGLPGGRGEDADLDNHGLDGDGDGDH